MTDRLKSCPFCGGTIITIESSYYTDIHSVMCKNCYAESDRYHTQEEAIKAWNTRKPMDSIVEKLEDLEIDYIFEELYPQGEAIKMAIEIVKEGGK